jgi:hypothetical protein
MLPVLRVLIAKFLGVDRGYDIDNVPGLIEYGISGHNHLF